MERLKNYSIAIVEDNRLYATVLSRYIQNALPNSEISIFECGEDFLTKSNLKHDLIITDFHLDGTNKKLMNGLELIKTLKQHKNIDSNIVMLSSQRNQSLEQEIQNIGGIGFRSKENFIKQTSTYQVQRNFESLLF